MILYSVLALLVVVIIFQMILIKDLVGKVTGSDGVIGYVAEKVAEKVKPSVVSMSDRTEYELECKKNGITPAKDGE